MKLRYIKRQFRHSPTSWRQKWPQPRKQKKVSAGPGVGVLGGIDGKVGTGPRGMSFYIRGFELFLQMIVSVLSGSCHFFLVPDVAEWTLSTCPHCPRWAWFRRSRPSRTQFLLVCCLWAAISLLTVSPSYLEALWTVLAFVVAFWGVWGSQKLVLRVDSFH